MKYIDGAPNKFKMRLTAKGCNQREGIDFDETFSPVARITTIRFLVAYAVGASFVFRQADITNAFPNASLDRTIYLDVDGVLAEILRDIIDYQPGDLIKLSKALYGLKQASRNWHQLVLTVLMQLGFSPLTCDTCAFIRGSLHDPPLCR